MLCMCVLNLKQQHVDFHIVVLLHGACLAIGTTAAPANTPRHTPEAVPLGGKV